MSRSTEEEYFRQSAHCGNAEITVMGCLDAFVYSNGVSATRNACTRCWHGKQVRAAVAAGAPIPVPTSRPGRCDSAIARLERMLDDNLDDLRFKRAPAKPLPASRCWAEDEAARFEDLCEQLMATSPQRLYLTLGEEEIDEMDKTKFERSRIEYLLALIEGVMPIGSKITAKDLSAYMRAAPKKLKLSDGTKISWLWETVFNQSSDLVSAVFCQLRKKPGMAEILPELVHLGTPTPHIKLYTWMGVIPAGTSIEAPVVADAALSEAETRSEVVHVERVSGGPGAEPFTGAAQKLEDVVETSTEGHTDMVESRDLGAAGVPGDAEMPEVVELNETPGVETVVGLKRQVELLKQELRRERAGAQSRYVYRTKDLTNRNAELSHMNDDLAAEVTALRRQAAELSTHIERVLDENRDLADKNDVLVTEGFSCNTEINELSACVKALRERDDVLERSAGTGLQNRDALVRASAKLELVLTGEILETLEISVLSPLLAEIKTAIDNEVQ